MWYPYLSRNDIDKLSGLCISMYNLISITTLYCIPVKIFLVTLQLLVKIAQTLIFIVYSLLCNSSLLTAPRKKTTFTLPTYVSKRVAYVSLKTVDILVCSGALCTRKSNPLLSRYFDDIARDCL